MGAGILLRLSRITNLLVVYVSFSVKQQHTG